MTTFKASIALAALGVSSLVSAHDHGNTSEFKVTEIKPHYYLMQGKGGNILASKGDDGVLIIDTDYGDMSDALLNQLKKWPEPLKYVINTHWHADHTGGNAAAGIKADIIAHDSVRDMLSHDQTLSFFNANIKAQKKEGLPSITFDDDMNLYFNDVKWVLKHLPAGHTNGDIVVSIDNGSLIHMGDHFFNGFFPFVDVEHGGRVDGMARNITAMLDSIPDDATIVPGHGPVGTKKDLVAFRDMLDGTYAEVKAMMDTGLDLEAIQKKGLSDRWDSWSGFIPEDKWISLVFDSIQADS